MTHGSKLTDELSKLVRGIDSVLYIIRIVSEQMNKLIHSLESLSVGGIAVVLGDALSAFTTTSRLANELMPSRDRCAKEYDLFHNMHSALILYNYDTLMLVRHSLLSALTAYYTVAFTELRSALESVIRGAVFDLLAIPHYRRTAKHLKDIKGRHNAPGFAELLELLEREAGQRRLEVSVEIFDLIDSKLKGFNPEARFTKLLRQLHDWGITEAKVTELIAGIYDLLSRQVHRSHPAHSEVGIRIVTNRDWLELEPVPEALMMYLNVLSEVTGIVAYLVPRVFSIDLQINRFAECIDWTKLEPHLQRARQLAETYNSWKYVVVVLEQLKGPS